MLYNNLRIKITRDIAQKITEIGRKYKLKLVLFMEIILNTITLKPMLSEPIWVQKTFFK